jgi:cyclase
VIRPRIIPCLLVHNGGLVKTVRFSNPKYVGDPINAVRIFNEKEVDELIVVDIDATVQGKEPDYDLIRDLASECRMPLCYGGGVSSVRQVERIISLGVEKVAISSAAVRDDAVIRESSRVVGSQSVVVVLDVGKDSSRNLYEVWTHNGRVRTGWKVTDLARRMAECGAGEIVVNSIDRDGTMEGYDIELARLVRAAVDTPITILGGAGSLRDIGNLIAEIGIVGAAAGSLFVFKGPYRAVLINYPSRVEKDALVNDYMRSCSRHEPDPH